MRRFCFPWLSAVAGVGLLLATAPAQARDVVNFDDLSLPPNTYYNGADGAGGFISGGAYFNNTYNATYGTWGGWSYSDTTDVSTPGFMNQYSAYHLPNGGGFRSTNYGVVYNFSVGDAFVLLPTDTRPVSMRVTNTTYAALSMRDGDQFAKKFGGPDGTDPDWFLLTIYGLDDNYNITGVVEFYLADYRYENKYIIQEWTKVDLTPLGPATTLLFGLSSTDNGPFGMNTPAYFAVDNLVVR